MKKLIATYGPSFVKNPALLKTFQGPDVIFRLNGAHGDVAAHRESIRTIRGSLPTAKILIDLPGNKVRTSSLQTPIDLRAGESFKVAPHQLNFPDFFRYISPGQNALANDSTFRFTVQSVGADGTIEFLSHSTGTLTSNKGIHVKGVTSQLPFLFERDRNLIELANAERIQYVGLSFVRTAQDIDEAKKLIDPSIELMPKVETLSAVQNLASILNKVDIILVDRGDLSTDVTLEKVPFYQNYIIEKAGFFNKKVILATQFLKNMETKPVPTIAEVIDLYNTLKKGVWGIQLSEETAVGLYPAECYELFKRIVHEIYHETPTYEGLE